MCRTSKSLNGIYTGRLYEEVDLLHSGMDINRTWHRQAMFLKAIKAHPEYSTHVQELYWTFTNLRREDEKGWLPLLPSYSASEPHGMWEVLSMLTNVSRVKINELETIYTPFNIDVPEGLTLFPRAKSISIFGTLMDTIVEAILRVSKAR